MLCEEVVTRGVRIVRAEALPLLWQNSVGGTSRSVSALFAVLITNPLSVLHYYLGADLFGLPNHIPNSDIRLVDDVALATAIHRVAREYGHDAISEAHAFRALLELCPSEVEEQIVALQAMRLKSLDATPPQDRPGAAERKFAELRVLRARLGKPIRKMTFGDRTDIELRLSEYLSSEYYPFGEDEWRRYKSEARQGGNTLGCFASHQIRDRKLNM